jgi:subtilisin-like proprotein convertase family protein
MRLRRFMLFLLCLLCGAGAWFFLRHAGHSPVQGKIITPTAVTTRSLSTAPQILTGQSVPAGAAKTIAAAKTNRFAYRLSNTTKTIGELVRDNKAVLLENALIDTANPLNLSIPANLRAAGDPGAYIVQARGPTDNAFRAMLAQAGVTIVAYIPNNAYLVRASASVAGTLGASPLTQAVIAYEPYYKIQSSLLEKILQNEPLPPDFNIAVFPDAVKETRTLLNNAGWTILSQQSSPFGMVFTVQGQGDVTALARMSELQIIEPAYPSMAANDLSRATVGVAANSLTNGNYLGLTGAGVTVEVNDTGIDANHPDLTGQVFGNLFDTNLTGRAGWDLVDNNGHGTHVAGIIAGTGVKSSTLINVSGSTMPGINGQFRGMANGAALFSVAALDNNGEKVVSDQALQEIPALTNALISNNSWNYAGDNQYDLAAASYDAAVRDALPAVPGSQPVLFVFAAGNSGAGGDSGAGGNADTILSPATAKDVITVGATEQLRKITNVVTALVGSSNAVWQPMTDSSNQVAGFSSRGNVGIGVEGTFGRYKPDVVAPGTFVVSTRSEQWDTNAYYNPTNYNLTGFSDVAGSDSANFYSLLIPKNIVQVTIQLLPNIASPTPFPSLPILVWNGSSPRTSPPYLTGAGSVALPPPPITPVNLTWEYAVSNNTSETVSYDVQVDIVTTNDNGNYYQVLQGLNDSLDGNVPPHYYRYESGTSMSAADVSGVLALMQQFYTNAYHVLPSPAMLKAMLINGARATADNSFQVQNAINFQGWGMVNLPAALQPGITNQLNVPCSAFIQDQNPTNALATGDSQTFFVSVTNAQAQQQPLRITLAWTDPPGDPAAAIKLVNNLVLVVTNLNNPTNTIIYYGNDIGLGNTFNIQRTTNASPNFDSVNNIQNVYIAPLLGSNYSVTVLGYRVNVNAVTAQTNNVVQDYALAISCGSGQVTNAMIVSAASPASNPTGDRQITYLSATNNGPLLNQFVGANTPLLGTNTLPFTVTAPEDLGTNWQVTVGMTNQWHFYVVKNTNGAFPNAAFVTFIPDTLSIPRMGVFANSQADATRPEADIDLYVTTDSTLTNLNPVAISNCVVGTQVGASSVGPTTFAGASLSRLGTEFVADTNSQPGEIYYVGVKSEDQMASEYAFLSVFSATPFSQVVNGIETVFGVPVPVNIPDGSPALPGIGYVIGLALQPILVDRVMVTNVIPHQNFGDLIGNLTHNAVSDVLNNHDSIGNSLGLTFAYDDTPYSHAPSDGPGSLNSFIGQQGVGAWILTEVDNSLTQTGSIQSSTVTLQPHKDLLAGVTVSIQGGGWFYGYLDVPPGATNLTISATNVTLTPDFLNPLQLFAKFGSFPTLTNFDKMTLLNNPGLTGPGGSLSIGPPLTSGRYFVGIFNPSASAQTVYIIATIGLGTVPAQVIYSSSGPVPILDDAVTTNSIIVPDNQTISSLEVALRVDHPRVSDLVFHLIGPDGTRDLLVENRGGTTANRMGATLTSSGIVAQTFSGSYQTTTNIINPGTNSGTLQISYNFFIAPDELALFYTNSTTNFFDSGVINGSGVFSVPYTNSPIVIVMNPYGNSDGPGDAWTFTVDALQTNQFTYLVLTEDTNKTTTPIKFAPPLFAATNDLYYLPEESLDAYDGLNAQGLWTLEIQDDRVGATNPAPSLVSWQLRFNYVTTGTSPNGIPSGPQTNVIQPGSWVYYPVNVPTNADYATNLLIFATGPLNVWFNQTNDPTGTNTSDYLLLAGATNGSSTLSTFSVPTNIVPGGVYYLGLQNTNAFPVTNGFEVDFHLYRTPLSLTNGVPVTNTISGTIAGDGMAYYSVTVPSDADYATNLLLSFSVPVNVWFNQTKVPVGLSPPDSLLISNSTNGVAVLSAGSTPPLVPGATYYLAVQNTNGPSATFVLEVNFHRYTPLANGVPATNSVPPNSFAYYEVQVPTNADAATNLLLFASLPVNVWFDQYGVPTGFYSSDYLLITNATNGISILTGATTPPLVPGATYYLGVQNTNAVTVNFALEVNFHLVLPPSISDFTITRTNNGVTNGFLLTWDGPTNYQYSIQWATSLAPPIPWNTVLNPVINLVPTPTNGNYSWFDDGSLSGGWPPLKFYRVLASLNSAPITNSAPVTNVIVAGTITPLTVTVPANAIAASNVLVSASGPVNVWFNQTNPPTGTGPGDVLMLSNVTGGSFVLNGSSLPPLVPGANYYLGLQNPGTSNITFVFQVNFAYATASTNPVSISSATVTNLGGGTNGILLKWIAPTNYQFQVQWATNLVAPIPWTTISNLVVTWSGIVSPTNTADGLFEFLDDGSLTGGLGPWKFYRLIEYPYSTPIPQSLSIINVGLTAGSVQFQWVAPTNYSYEIEWTTNLTLPYASWSILANPALWLSNDVFTFTDTNQTGPATSPKFFRLIEP